MWLDVQCSRLKEQRLISTKMMLSIDIVPIIITSGDFVERH